MIPVRLFAVAMALTLSAYAADPAPSASELAAKLSALRQDGSSYVRLKMDTNGGTLQLQIKQRLTKNGAEVLYQVLFPKERKGESVLVKRSGSKVTGSVFVPPNTIKPIDDPRDALFGSDLSYEDVVENFYAWDQQTITGTETIDGANCQVLESKPGKGERTIYASVKSWIDTRRLVPLRVEKYGAGGKLVRRITTTRVVNDGGKPIPANLEVQGPQSGTTSLDGSRIRHDVTYQDQQFTPEGMKELTGPPGAAE